MTALLRILCIDLSLFCLVLLAAFTVGAALAVVVGWR
jgi:hypothetical protein